MRTPVGKEEETPVGRFGSVQKNGLPILLCEDLRERCVHGGESADYTDDTVRNEQFIDGVQVLDENKKNVTVSIVNTNMKVSCS